MAASGMTGFGRAEGETLGWAWIWEARSVNGRGLDVKTRLPAGFEALEPAARELAQARFRRGSVQISLSLSRPVSGSGVAVDHALIEALLQAGAPYLDRGVAPPRWDGLLQVRGVVTSDDRSELDAASREALEAALKAGLARALDALGAARAQDGAGAVAALDAALDRIASATVEAGAAAAAQPAALAERLKARIAALAPEVQLDPQRFAQEVALLAARADVREELDRLAAHVAEARALLKGLEPAGRRLEFLAQELNREANTLGAKAADLALTRLSLDLKTAIDQFREQAANVE